jgi:transcriptional regulator with PAS, ATPase and Fis domain
MQYIEEKKFRRDLYYRVAGVPITIPPLRERRDDILPLAEHFLQMSGIQHKRKYVMNADTRKLFLQYDWPGNIRELRNTVDYAAIMAVDGDITGACLPPTLTSNLGDDAATVPLSRRVSEFERREILKEVQQFGTGTEAKRKAAEVLGISLSSLYAKLGK